MATFEHILEAKNHLLQTFGEAPQLGLVLGSGLGSFTDSLANRSALAYEQIPHWPPSRVPGHSGELVVGELEGMRIVALSGRVHYYEGYTLDEVCLGVRALAQWGVKSVIITNSSGGVNRDYKPGALMLIKDHLNLMGINPLLGQNDERFGPRFIDLSVAYDASLRSLMIQSAERLELTLYRGVYAALSGPSYETPSEVRMLRTLGADAVGMSTVPEVIAARQMGVRVAGISCIANAAAGIFEESLSHEEVKATAQKTTSQLVAILRDSILHFDTQE